VADALVVGPHRYTRRDATRLVSKADLLFDHLGEVPEAVRLPVLTAAEAGLAPGGDLGAAVAAFDAAWADATEAARAQGTFGPTVAGTVVGCFTSDGGVPKAARDRLDVGVGGVAGDRQIDRKHHGAPFQAVCLWSAEVIDDFRAAGHPLAPGLAGENLTIAGIPWVRVRPGARLRVGEVLLEISAPATPCGKNRGWFLDGRFDLMAEERGPVSRMYAWVREPGEVRVGDAAVLEPGPTGDR